MAIARERPQCRKAIETRGIKPYILNGAWDGSSYWKEGRVHSVGLSDGMRQQLRKMVKEGLWGPVRFVNDLFPNPTRVEPTDEL